MKIFRPIPHTWIEFSRNAGERKAHASPNEDWVIPPVASIECLLVATLDRNEGQRERQNLDQAGHYVTRRVVDRRRQNVTSSDA